MSVNVNPKDEAEDFELIKSLFYKLCRQAFLISRIPWIQLTTQDSSQLLDEDYPDRVFRKMVLEVNEMMIRQVYILDNDFTPFYHPRRFVSI